MNTNVWAIVLAAGEGTRLAPLTRALYGHDLPKQFAALPGERTFLQQTLDRIAPLVPPDRTVVVVSAERQKLARKQLRGYRGLEIVVQPANRGTGPGVLLPLAHVLARDPRARVAVFPSDHHVDQAMPLLDAVRGALDAAEVAPAGVALVGAEADRAATDLGWIVPRRDGGDTTPRVSRFVEKPALPAARALLAEGALWNTMIVAGGAAALWHLLRRHMPLQARGMAAYLPRLRGRGAAEALQQVYAEMEPADLSRDVLERAPGLAVVRMRDAGWSDCGTPERLAECLVGKPALGKLLDQLRRRDGQDARLMQAAFAAAA